MTRRELVKAAIRHQETPRTPYLIDLCPEGWDVIRQAGLDGGRSMGEFLDNDVEDIPVPWWDWHGLAPEWKEAVPPPLMPPAIGRGSYEKMTDEIKARREKSDKYFLVRLYGSHFEKAYFARGIENFLADMASEPEYARRLLNGIIEKNLVMIENFMAIKEIDGVLLGSDWGSQIDLLMSPATWEDMIRPGEKKEYDLIHSYGKDVWVHSCGCIKKIIPSLIEIGLDVLNPVQPEAMDIRELKAKFGRKLTFWGGISTQQTLPYGTPEEVKAEARAVRDMMKKGGGYIFSPAQSIQGDVPPANIAALLETARG